METNRPAHPDRIALISPPWPLYTRPSIQIGALKAFVRSRFPAVEVSAHHVYLRVAEAIGYKQYHAISERTWLAESVFAALLYPDRAETIARLFRREASGNPELRGMDFARLAARVEAVTEAWISSANWGDVPPARFHQRALPAHGLPLPHPQAQAAPPAAHHGRGGIRVQRRVGPGGPEALSRNRRGRFRRRRAPPGPPRPAPRARTRRSGSPSPGQRDPDPRADRFRSHPPRLLPAGKPGPPAAPGFRRLFRAPFRVRPLAAVFPHPAG